VHIVRSDQIVADAALLPALSMVWHDSPYDEHPIADVTKGQTRSGRPSTPSRPPEGGTTRCLF
jgi:hypothetical protein